MKVASARFQSRATRLRRRVEDTRRSSCRGGQPWTLTRTPRHRHLRRPIRPLARYRVMARHRDQSQSLVTLAENARQAANLAKAFCDALDAGGSHDGIISVRTRGMGRDTHRRRVAADKPVAWRVLALVSTRGVQERRPPQPIPAKKPATRSSASSWATRPARAAGKRNSCNAERKGRSRTPGRAQVGKAWPRRSCSAWERSARTASESSSTGRRPTTRSVGEWWEGSCETCVR